MTFLTIRFHHSHFINHCVTIYRQCSVINIRIYSIVIFKVKNILSKTICKLKGDKMIIYNNKGNPYGLKVEICVRLAGSNIEIREINSAGIDEYQWIW